MQKTALLLLPHITQHCFVYFCYTLTQYVICTCVTHSHGVWLNLRMWKSAAHVQIIAQQDSRRVYYNRRDTVWWKSALVPLLVVVANSVVSEQSSAGLESSME